MIDDDELAKFFFILQKNGAVPAGMVNWKDIEVVERSVSAKVMQPAGSNQQRKPKAVID